jgi:hypothetical protein
MLSFQQGVLEASQKVGPLQVSTFATLSGEKRTLSDRRSVSPYDPAAQRAQKIETAMRMILFGLASKSNSLRGNFAYLGIFDDRVLRRCGVVPPTTEIEGADRPPRHGADATRGKNVRREVVEAMVTVTPCRDLGASRLCRNGAAERKRRGDGGNGFRALADALNGEITVVHKAAKDTLVNIDALNFVEPHFKGPSLDEAGFVDNPHVGYVGLGSPAVKPRGRRPVQGRKSSDRRQCQAN